MKDVNPSQLLPKNSIQQQISKELEYMPLQGMSPIEEGSINPESRASNIEYAPLDIRTRSWEVATNDVQIKKIIGKGAFGQVAKGMAKNLPFRPEATSVAIKMVKGNVFFFFFFLLYFVLFCFCFFLLLLFFNYCS